MAPHPLTRTLCHRSLKQPEPAVLARFPGPGRTFLGLPESGCVVVATGRDPSAYEYTGALRQATDQWASVATHTGGAAVTPSDYMAAVGALQVGCCAAGCMLVSTLAAQPHPGIAVSPVERPRSLPPARLQPDVFVALSDDVPCDSKPQRAATSVDRSLAWLRECAHLRATDAGLQQSALFAAIQVGGWVGGWVHENVGRWGPRQSFRAAADVTLLQPSRWVAG